MKPASPHETIAIDALRVGMFVHLDLGWMKHPFPLSSFRIENAEQLATLRGLGLQRVRWSPRQSVTAHEAEPAAELVAGVPLATASAVTASPPDDPVSRAKAERRRAREAERAALAVCERQYNEASGALKKASDLVTARPGEAREQVEQLSKALVDKMLAPQELCIRLLGDGVGDRSAMHGLNVAIVALLMGRNFGWGPDDLLDLGVGAMLHDMGKVELPERVRHRDDRFSAAEQRAYEDHVARGVVLAGRLGLSPGATLVVAQHHEHADGSGFPSGLGADRMSPAARIVAVVNRYDKLCNPPLGGKALTPHEALSLLFAQGKSRFDTAILGAFIKMMGVYPPGTTVQLTDDRFAMVVSVNSTRPLKPRVLVHEAGVSATEAAVLDLEGQANLGIRRSLNPLALPADSMAVLSPRKRVAYFFEPAREAEAVV